MPRAIIRGDTDRCTTILVGAEASVDGPMTTHTSDCADCDFRLSKTPAMDWPEGTMRPLYLYKSQYPGLYTSDRGSTWHPKNIEGTKEQKAAWKKNATEIVTHIPQVRHTYALVEGGYGIMNEFQVSIGESTCAARLWSKPITAGGHARIEARDMTMIALERGKTAREVVRIMGELAESLGFYGADWSGGDLSLGEAGEALTVADKTEAWIFHVLPDDTGRSAVWAAYRIPSHHVAVVANQFVLRKIPRSPSDDWMYSSNIYEVAKRAGFWTEKDGELDFLLTFAPPRAHAPYATRRVWRIFDWLSPDLKLDGDTKDPYARDYPVSVPVNLNSTLGVVVDTNDKGTEPRRLLRLEDVITMQRDHYEGTKYDLTKGVAAGPYGDPNRFDISATSELTFEQAIQGSFDRSISLFRTSYSFVATPRATVPDELALVWIGQYAPSACAYTPVYVASMDMPCELSRGSLHQYDPRSAFWAFAAVGNYAARFYKYAMQDVFAAQNETFAAALASVKHAEAKILRMASSVPTVAMVNWATQTAASLDGNNSTSAMPMMSASSPFDDLKDAASDAWESFLNDTRTNDILDRLNETDLVLTTPSPIATNISHIISNATEAIGNAVNNATAKINDVVNDTATTVGETIANSTASSSQVYVIGTPVPDIAPFLKPAVTAILTATTVKSARMIVRRWRDLFPEIITKYHDGYIAHGLDRADLEMERMFYPVSWLNSTGYFNNKPYEGEGVIMFAPSPILETPSSSSMLGTIIVTAIFTAIATAASMQYYIYRTKRDARGAYVPI